MVTEGKKYEQVVSDLEEQIRNGALKAGDKVPSLRVSMAKHGVSMNTVLHAYSILEGKGLVVSREKYGFYVSVPDYVSFSEPSVPAPLLACGTNDIEEMISRFSGNRWKSKVLLSHGIPDPSLLPVSRLTRMMHRAMLTLPNAGSVYSHQGSAILKKQVARRVSRYGIRTMADQVITTSGCMEAISFCLMAVTSPGDTIVVESPVYYGTLQLARLLKLKVLELPSHPVTGVSPDQFRKIISIRKIAACILVSNFSNPLGSCMPEEAKLEFVRLSALKGIPIIEDDIYGDLNFGSTRPNCCKSYDEEGLVLYCNSFSKTLASGYRVGYVLAGKYSDRIRRIKAYQSVSTNTIAHEAMGLYLDGNYYEKHLKGLRSVLYSNMLRYHKSVFESFPEGTRISKPQGSFHIWVELPVNYDALALYDLAIRRGISMAPGSMYTLHNRYRNCFRLSFGLIWSDEIEKAIRMLGKLAHQVG